MDLIMECNSGLFIYVPPEIKELIFQNLSIKDGYNLATTCKYFERLILSQNGWNWHKLGKKLQIKKVTKKKSWFPLAKKKSKKSEVTNFIKKYQKNEDTTFYSGSLDLQKIKLQLRIRPPLKEAIDKMKQAALKGKEDSQTFDSLAPVVLPFIKDKQILRQLYTQALGTLPQGTIDKMLKINAVDLKDSHFQDYIEIRKKMAV